MHVAQIHHINIEDAVRNISLPINGLMMQQNVVSNNYAIHNISITKTLSSEGPMISDFVTHQPDFQYTTYGIHIGQDDRLTFFLINSRVL